MHSYSVASYLFSFIIVRLVNGHTKYEGRVEVYHSGEWGTVNDYNWNLKDAQVVCNELGYGKAIAAAQDAYYGQGRGRTWLDKVHCTGTEKSIGDCSLGNWNYGYSSHYGDVGVKCTTGNFSKSASILYMYLTLCKIIRTYVHYRY